MDTKAFMGLTLASLKQELRGIRTGRADSGLVGNIRVDYFGTPTAITNIASIAIPEPRMIVIKPFDPSVASDVARAIQLADIGLNPQSDGKVIRVPVPPLSEENRAQIARRVKEMGETTKVALRNVRRESNRDLNKAQASKEITEDECHRQKADIQKMLGEFENTVDKEINKTSEQLEAY